MHTRLKKTRVKRWRAPKPVPPPKPPRPKRTQLKHIYSKLVSSSRDERLEALKKAMHWYEGLQAYLAYNSELTFHQKKAKAAAEKLRLTGLNSDKDTTKELSYIAAIKSYEKMGLQYHVPKIGAYLSKYSHKRAQLVKRKSRYDKKFKEFLSLVDYVLRPVNYEDKRIELHVDKISSKYRIDSVGNITFDRKFLDNVKRASRTSGLLPGVQLLFPALSDAASTIPEVDGDGHRTGRFRTHGSHRYISVLTMLDNLIKYQLNDKKPKRLIRHSLALVHRKTVAA
jgi:hypothetical protein